MPIPQTWTYPETIHAASWNDVRLYKPASYIVFAENSLCYAYGQSSGLTDYSGSSAASVIQSALNGLSSGRTWKEKVVCIGNFTLTDSITLPSYTILEIQGKFSMGNSVNKNMLILQGIQYVDIVGGFLDGNKTSNTSGSIIYMNNPTYLGDVISSISNVFINNSAFRGIEIYGWCNGTKISGTDIYGSAESGFWLETGDVILSNCVAGQSGRIGFYVGAVVGYQLVNCKSFGNGRDSGSFTEGEGFLIAGSSSLLANCYAQDNRRHGFLIYSTDPETYGRFNVLVGCAGEGNSFDTSSAIGFGIRIDSCTDNKVIGSSFIDRHYSSGSVTQIGGIWLAGNSSRNTIIGCDVTTNLSYGLSIDTGAVNNTIIDVNGYGSSVISSSFQPLGGYLTVDSSSGVTGNVNVTGSSGPLTLHFKNGLYVGL